VVYRFYRKFTSTYIYNPCRPHDSLTQPSGTPQNRRELAKKKWKIKVNETKSSHITFTLRKDNFPAISINRPVLPQVESVKCLGLHFDCKLNLKEHVFKKRKQTDLKVKEINWLIGRNSNLSLENK